MKFVCENCGEVGSDKERWFYGPVDMDKVPLATIEKLSKLKCKRCAGQLFLEEGAYETLRDGSPFRKPTLKEALGVKKHLIGFAMRNKKQLKEEKQALDADGE